MCFGAAGRGTVVAETLRCIESSVTYILGWKCDGDVYLCGDTAMSHGLPGLVQTTHSSFGEAHIGDSGKYVSESIIKVIRLDQAAVALTGDVLAAKAFIKEFAYRLKSDGEVEQALERTVASRSPFAADKEFSLLVAGPTDSGAQLFAFNPNGNHDTVECEEGGIAQLGSASVAHKAQTSKWLGPVTGHFRNDPNLVLAMALTGLQSYGIHDYLLAEGVGGPFCGLRVDKTGSHWQKDMLTVIYGPDLKLHGMVSTLVRDNVLIAESNITNTTRLFADDLMGGLDAKWLHQKTIPAKYIRAGLFDYVGLLSNGQRTATVAEMKGQLKSAYLEIAPPPPYAPGDDIYMIKLGLSPALKQRMNLIPDKPKDGTAPFAISWFSFEEDDSPAPSISKK